MTPRPPRGPILTLGRTARPGARVAGGPFREGERGEIPGGLALALKTKISKLKGVAAAFGQRSYSVRFYFGPPPEGKHPNPGKVAAKIAGVRRQDMSRTRIRMRRRRRVGILKYRRRPDPNLVYTAPGILFWIRHELFCLNIRGAKPRFWEWQPWLLKLLCRLNCRPPQRRRKASSPVPTRLRIFARS